jgi:hypothetical protein
MDSFTDRVRSMFGTRKPKRPTITAPIQTDTCHGHGSKPAGDNTESSQPQVQHFGESRVHDTMNEPVEAAQSNDAGNQQAQDTADGPFKTMAERMNTGGSARSTRPLSTVPEHLSSPRPHKPSDGLKAIDTMLSSRQHSISRSYTSLKPVDHILFDAISTRSEHTMGNDTATSTLHGDHEQEPIGQWRCCKCKRGQDLYLNNQGQHLVSILNCVCPHRSCENCTLTGLIKPYQPVQEPIPVPLSSDKHKLVRFGMFCGSCGLSWRAQLVKGSMLQHISAMPKNLAKCGSEKMRRSKSMNNLLGTVSTPKAPVRDATVLNLRALSNEMEKQHGKQAGVVMVTFSGIQCTCGRALDTSALCFQVAEPPDEPVMTDEVVADTSRFTATPSDLGKGIGTSTITFRIKGKTFSHLNPLMSNPVTSDKLARLEEKSVRVDGPHADLALEDEYDSDATVRDG